MTESSTITAHGASAESPMFDYVTSNDLFAVLAGRRGTISVEEFPRGEIAEAADAAQRAADRDDACAAIVLSLTADEVGGIPYDTVWFHPDQDDRLDVIRRARAALEAAEAALHAVGYVDKVHLRDRGDEA